MLGARLVCPPDLSCDVSKDVAIGQALIGDFDPKPFKGRSILTFGQT